ncbi:MAG TPA: phosphoribosylformylglycinamidine synthase subunit PurQ [Lacipirellulaceae bacterium]|nr:phosphoribosylformylglycinamidine synthase subunit PurQ [Lacipirellulaceae bacterium]
MAQPRILVLRAPGTNCDEETAHAFSLAGGVPERWHVNRLLEEPARVADFQILCIPGGFSYGDDISAGRILGNQLRHHLTDQMEVFRAASKLILGICNGFQVLLKTQLLVPLDAGSPTATLTLNDSGRFEARWVRLQVDPGNCIFLQGIHAMELPIAHAEGKFVVRDPNLFASCQANGQFVMRYTTLSSQSAIRNPQSEIEPTTSYPANPNGAMGDVAGVCDETGRVFGLMPHPERFVDPTQHPRWTREPARDAGDGLAVFQNAVRYFL